MPKVIRDFGKGQEVSVLLHVPNQKYKQIKIKNGQNDCSGNSSVKWTQLEMQQLYFPQHWFVGSMRGKCNTKSFSLECSVTPSET